ncbi:MAG TPA: exopolysaccharide biosynthesis polyprenyl glycosylphosphotransferase [Rhodopila sp.]|nr:exopolysaccharide biosynthesis polyprenyl glycosylphosphotransferase [Rhodopila sp.]
MTKDLAGDLSGALSWPDIPGSPDEPASTRAGYRDAAWYTGIPRRILDITVSLGLLLLTGPLMVLVGCLVAIDSRGPILYRQVRVGLNGRAFVLLKFRSMVADAEAGTGPRWAQRQDPRITRIGKFLRLTRIDELPQLLNVLRGSMSMVGPRPERPHFADRLAEVIPGYRQRVTVKPGLTGWAQVNYPYGASVEDAKMKLSYDLHYIKNRSLFLDIRILLATVPVVLLGRGAR